MRPANGLAIAPELWLSGLAATALVPTAFALCRFAAGLGDNERRFFSGGHRTHIFDIVIMLLAIYLTAAGNWCLMYRRRLSSYGRLIIFQSDPGN
jgi:hypothetical protein